MTTITKLESVKAALEDAELWVKQMREGVNKWSDGNCGLDARCQNLEAWIRSDVRPALATLDEVIAEVGEMENKRMCEIKNVSIDPGPFGSTIYSFELHFTGPPSQPPAESEGSHD